MARDSTTIPPPAPARGARDQIDGVPKSYVAYDDVEIGFGNKIPLWLFVFLY